MRCETKKPVVNGLRRFNPYPSYKESGVEWLGKFPAHWEMAPLFTVAKELDVPNKDGQETNVLSLSYGRIVRRDVSDNFGLMPESFDTYQIVDANSIVLRLTDLQNDKRSLRVGLAQERGIITSAYVALQARERILPKYAYYLLHAYDITKVFYALGGGVRQTMKFEDLKWMPIPVPNETEQHSISAYLDRETAKIDALVAKKERHVQLLAEKLNSLLEHVVAAERNCKEVRLSYYVDLLPGYAFESSVFSHDPTDIRLLRGVNVSTGNIRWDDVVYWPRSDAGKFPCYQLRNGDLVLGMDRPWIEAGIRVAEITEADVPSLLLQRVARLRAKGGLSQGYLRVLLSSPQFKDYFRPILTGISVPHISPEQILSFRVRLPDLAVQESKVLELQASQKRHDAMCKTLHSSMRKLQELRTAIISSAVTGAIDVREETA